MSPFVNPVSRFVDLSHHIERASGDPSRPQGVAALFDGTICVTDTSTIYFLNAEYEDSPDGHALEALANARPTVKGPYGVAQHEDAIIVVNTGIKGQHVRRLRMVDGFELARSASLDHPIEFAMAGNLLFVPSSKVVNVLDIHTLETIRTIGQFEAAHDCAVHDNELYIADWANRGELYVYGIGGEYHRTVSGGFGRPYSLCIRNDHIYLVEHRDDDSDDEDEDIDAEAGYRLLVLKLDGATFQEINFPDLPNGRDPFLISVSFLGSATCSSPTTALSGRAVAGCTCCDSFERRVFALLIIK